MVKGAVMGQLGVGFEFKLSLLVIKSSFFFSDNFTISSYIFLNRNESSADISQIN